MGGRYCAINSPLNLRSRDFCPHREPRGELIVQYRPPMSFAFIPYFIWVTICVFEAWEFLKTAKEYIYLEFR